MTVSGLTTASSIWVTAALGMAVGAGEFYLAIFATLIVLAVLTLFGYIQPVLERYKKAIELHIPFSGSDDAVIELEKEMERFRLKFERIKTLKKEGQAVFHYEMSGPKNNLQVFLKTLNKNKSVESFEY